MKLLTLIYQEEIHPSEGSKRIPAEEFSRLVDAEEILTQAKEEAKRYQQEVEKQCEELKEQAKEKGFAEGLETFNTHLIDFSKRLSQIRLELQKQILPLALRAARKIVAAQLTLQPDTLVDIVIQALAPVLQNHRFVIYVNKNEKEILESQKSRIREILDQVQSLSIQERNDISPGGCVIETESGIINATIENQWRALEAAFEKYMSS